MNTTDGTNLPLSLDLKKITGDTNIKIISRYEVINVESSEFTKIKMMKLDNPIILKAGIDGFLDTFDGFKVGKKFILRSGQVSEELIFKTLRVNENDEGHVSNIMAVIVND